MPAPEIQILVCVNERPPEAAKPCCAARDGLAVYRALQDRVKELGLRDRVLVTRTGCLKHCSRGVTVAVWPHNHWYGGVGLGDVEELLSPEALAGRELVRLRMPAGPWE